MIEMTGFQDLPSQQEISDALAALKRRLTAEWGQRLEKMVLYGSRARGDYDARSDVDVAVIVQGLDRPEKRRIYDVIAEVELEHLTPLSTLVLSSAEYHGLLDRERRIAVDVEREGVAI